MDKHTHLLKTQKRKVHLDTKVTASTTQAAKHTHFTLGKKALGLLSPSLQQGTGSLEHILEVSDVWLSRSQTHLQLFILSLQVFQNDLQLLLVLALALALGGVLLSLTPPVLLATVRGDNGNPTVACWPVH